MYFLKSLLVRSPFFYLLIVLLGAAHSLVNGGLLLFINNAIAGKSYSIFGDYDWVAFFVIIVFSIAASGMFHTHMIKLTNDILFDFELSILQKLRLSSYEQFQKLGNERVYTAINDSRVLANLPDIFINAFNALMMIVCCIIYLFWISVYGGVLILALMLTLLLFYLWQNKKIESDLNGLRDLHDAYYRYVIDLLNGFREIKMSSVRNDNLFNKFLKVNRDRGKLLSNKTNIAYMNNEITGNYSWYVVLGFVMFLLPVISHMSREQLSAFIVTILFLMGPVAILVTLLPTYSNVKIASQRLDRFHIILEERIIPDLSVSSLAIAAKEPFKQLELHEVSYDYYTQNQQVSFSFGPIDLKICAGELIFVTGGNGSGKSTFVNLITGLYKPKRGEILLNGKKILNVSHNGYSNNIAAVFTDHYLFSENYEGFDLVDVRAKIDYYLEMMRLEEVVRINPEKNRLDHKLSKGQQKRLALIYAMMEDRQILVLDEWAAEQDPVFRAYFYNNLLQNLINKGKTIIAITHDDAYFKNAHRILKFDSGKIAAAPLEEPTNPSAAYGV